MARVLLLNLSYEPLHICSWKRAIVLLMKGKAEELEHNGKLINNETPLPSVIRLLHYVMVPYREIPLNRRNILHRDNYTCQYCGKKHTALTIDHVIPKSRGGKDRWDNVVAACERCNNKKSNKTPREANMPLLKTPVAPTDKLMFEITKQADFHYEWEKYIE